MNFKEGLPEFYEEILRILKLRASDLVEQLPYLRITRRCDCGEASCSTFSVEGGQSPFSIEEQKDRGPYLSDSIDLDAKIGMVVLDLDHLRRIKSFEILNRPDVHEKLKAMHGI